MSIFVAMAILIEDMHDFIRGILKKTYGSFVSPEDIDRALDRAQYDLLNEIMAKYEADDEYRDDETFIVKSDQAITTGGGNQITLPADYVKMIGFFYKDGSNNEFEGKLLKHKAYQDRRQSVIVPPTTSRPIGTIFDNKLEVLPAGDHTYTLLYWKEPATPNYAYTQAGGVITFNDGSATDLDWDKKDFTELATRALKYLGFSLKDGEVVQLEASTEQ